MVVMVVVLDFYWDERPKAVLQLSNLAFILVEKKGQRLYCSDNDVSNAIWLVKCKKKNFFNQSPEAAVVVVVVVAIVMRLSLC